MGELSAYVGEGVAEPAALAEARREDLVELEKGSRIVERSDRERRRPIRVRIVCALGGRHRREVARPARERERCAVDRPVELELALDRRNEERRELRRPVDAETGDLIASRRTAASQPVCVMANVMPSRWETRTAVWSGR